MGPKTRLAVGLAICIVAAALMIVGVVGVGWGSALGMIGVGVVSTAGLKPTPANR